MSNKLNPADKERLIQKLQSYFEREFDTELGQFDADFLLDFIFAEIGPTFYNQGLYDAQAILESKMDSITEAITEIEKPLSY